LFCLILVCSIRPINKLKFLLTEELYFLVILKIKLLRIKPFKFINASKEKSKCVSTSLRKHGAETQLNKERSPTPDRRLDYSQPTTSSRVAHSEPARTDKTYPGAQPKRIVIQTYSAPPVSHKIRSYYNVEEITSDSSDEEESSSNSCNTESYRKNIRK
jgi:hypothetical protein